MRKKKKSFASSRFSVRPSPLVSPSLLCLFFFFFFCCSCCSSSSFAAETAEEREILEPEWPFLPNRGGGDLSEQQQQQQHQSGEGERSETWKEGRKSSSSSPNFISSRLFRELPVHLTRNKVRSSAILETLMRTESDREEEEDLRKIDDFRQILEAGQDESEKAKAIEGLINIVQEKPKRKEAWRELGLALQQGRHSVVDEALARASKGGSAKKTNANEQKRISTEKKSVYFLQRAADLGDAEAHFELAFLYSTGLGGVVEKDEGLAMTHHYFAARGGDVRSHLALGHRHAKGRFAPKSCQASVLYYHPASLKTVEPVVAPVMGENGQKGFDNFRLSRDMKSPKRLKRQKDVVTYYQYAADLGNSDAQSAVGHAYMLGTKGLDVNYDIAVKYLDLAAAQGNAEAMSSLGHAYANGLGVAQNNETALRWFKEAKKLGSPHASYGLAYMYLSGFGVEKNAQEAVKELLKAAERGSMEAQFHLGALHVRGVSPLARDYTKANTYFGLAAAQGHSLASYNLAMMQLGGLGAPISCAPALDKLKLLAERSSTVVNVMENAREYFVRRLYKESLYAYAKASEMGVELAQANAAYILERNFGRVQDHLTKEERKRFSLYFHELAADQGNVLSLLTIGDAHYAGLISSSVSSKKDDGLEETLMVTDEDGNAVAPLDMNSDSNYEKAAEVYRRAAGLRSAAAMFNLGRMHEVGRGVAKDYHLAKRFYDSTLSAEPDAKFIVKFALWQLRVREWIEAKDWKNKDYKTIVSDIFRELLLLRPGIFNSNVMSVGEDDSKRVKKVIMKENARKEKTNPPPSSSSSSASGSATEDIAQETNKIIEWGKKNSDLMLVIALGVFLVITLGVRSILAVRHHQHRD
jgi:SEL1 protein